MAIDPTFLDAFWPNFAATVIGIALGVPVALCLNRKAVELASKQAKAEDDARLKNALVFLVASIDHNVEKLAVFQESLNGNSLVFELGIDVAAWDATQSQITKILGNPDLYRKMALHYSSLENIMRIYISYFDMITGLMSAMTGAEVQREYMRNFLKLRTYQLINEACSLKTEIQLHTESLITT